MVDGLMRADAVRRWLWLALAAAAIAVGAVSTRYERLYVAAPGQRSFWAADDSILVTVTRDRWTGRYCVDIVSPYALRAQPRTYRDCLPTVAIPAHTGGLLVPKP
jgi:hypothetical protein